MLGSLEAFSLALLAAHVRRPKESQCKRGLLRLHWCLNFVDRGQDEVRPSQNAGRCRWTMACDANIPSQFRRDSKRRTASINFVRVQIKTTHLHLPYPNRVRTQDASPLVPNARFPPRRGPFHPQRPSFPQVNDPILFTMQLSNLAKHN